MDIKGPRSAKGHLSQNHELVDLRPAEVSIARPWRIGSLIIHSDTSVSISMHKHINLNGDKWGTNIRSIQGTESVIIMSKALVGLGRGTYNLNKTTRVSISDPDSGIRWVQEIQDIQARTHDDPSRSAQDQRSPSGSRRIHTAYITMDVSIRSISHIKGQEWTTHHITIL